MLALALIQAIEKPDRVIGGDAAGEGRFDVVGAYPLEGAIEYSLAECGRSLMSAPDSVYEWAESIFDEGRKR